MSQAIVLKEKACPFVFMIDVLTFWRSFCTNILSGSYLLKSEFFRKPAPKSARSCFDSCRSYPNSNVVTANIRLTSTDGTPQYMR